MNVRQLAGARSAAALFQTSLSRRRMLSGMAGLGAALTVAPRLSWAQSATPSAATAADGTWASWTKYNLNVITSDQILTIPSAGNKMTHEFAEYRPYATILTFRKEIGKYVDESVVAGYEKYVFVPIDPTQVDEATLATLPGVSADEAATLAKGVPYASDDAFLQAVSAVVSAEQAAAIPMYLASKAQPSVTWVKFNLNKASDDQLKTIPGVDDATLQTIKAAMPYDSIKTFRSDLGKSVDASVVSVTEGYVYVPVDVTKADGDTLAQLPGVGSDQADELIKGVPYASADAFMQALTAQVSAEQAAQAKEYLA